MAEFKAMTRLNKMGLRVNPKGKARVYFVCHPEDFSRRFCGEERDLFSMMVEDVLSAFDCAVYYTPDMSDPHDEANIDTDLGNMNLFIVPVTQRLLCTPNRAMAVDIPCAKRNNIPILPFLMEADIANAYAHPDNFGDRQYINPNSNDASEISYKNKLAKSLESFLTSDEMASRVREAFDAYIFLSYRKKDRRYANELMHLIHDVPGCQDVAIWYDEFLLPGENWRESIKDAMAMVSRRGNLFTLMVTPNLLEEYTDGEGNTIKNYVMATEYPEARDMKMNILPAEVEHTDFALLSDKYRDIPMPVGIGGDELGERIFGHLSAVLNTENDSDPAHSFLIGLAYLEGIDVEVDTERGIRLITSAAKAGIVDAMITLYNAYISGDKIERDYHKALEWAERIEDYYYDKYDEWHEQSLAAEERIAECYEYIDPIRARELREQIALTRILAFGENNAGVLSLLEGLAASYSEDEDLKMAYLLYQKIYSIRQQLFDPDDIETVEIGEMVELLRELAV